MPIKVFVTAMFEIEILSQLLSVLEQGPFYTKQHHELAIQQEEARSTTHTDSCQ